MRPHPLRVPCPVLPSQCPVSRQTSIFRGVYPDPRSSILPGSPTPAGPRCSHRSQDPGTHPAWHWGSSHGPRPPTMPSDWQILEPRSRHKALRGDHRPFDLLGWGGGGVWWWGKGRSGCRPWSICQGRWAGPGHPGIAETPLHSEAIRDLPSCPSVDGMVTALDAQTPVFLHFSTGKGLHLKGSVLAPHSTALVSSLPRYPRASGSSQPLGHTEAP